MSAWGGYRLRLNQKITLVVFIFALAPFTLLAAVLFGNMLNVVVTERVGEARRELLQIQTRAEKTAEMCSMTSQFFLGNAGLRDFLIKAGHGGAFTTEELIAFNRDDVSGFEKLVNANPYLYQVRVYHGNENVPEIMPILYHTKRMERLAWAGGDWSSGEWQFDYPDTIFSEEVLQPARNIMALVSGIEEFGRGRIGVLEVAVRMNEIFPDLFAPRRGGYSAFESGGEWFFCAEEGEFWGAHAQAVFGASGGGRQDGGDSLPGGGPAGVAPASDDPCEATLGGRRAIIASIPIKQFAGRYYIVLFRDDVTAGLAARRNLFIIGAAVSMLLLAFAVNLLVKTILRRFYRIVGAVRAVRAGSLDAEIPDVGGDEIGMLGDQINQMLDRIRKLMDENVKRGLLAKNSEIRALQSQINSHFIYNVLESIKMMAEVDSYYVISDALTSLGKMLRYGMRWASDSATVADELEHLRNYIQLINFRFDFNVVLKIDLPKRLLVQKVPKLIVQPIVENAVIHGIEGIASDTSIELSAMEYKGYYVLAITDFGRGIEPSKMEEINRALAGVVGEESGSGGIGLKNVHDRIIIAFGDDYGLNLISEAGRSTSVFMRMPYTVDVSNFTGDGKI